MGVQHMTTRTETGPFGVLGSLSPDMARDLGEAFSLERIGAQSARPKSAHTDTSGRAALRFASRVAAFLAVVLVAVSVALAALYLTQL